MGRLTRVTADGHSPILCPLDHLLSLLTPQQLVVSGDVHVQSQLGPQQPGSHTASGPGVPWPPAGQPPHWPACPGHL